MLANFYMRCAHILCVFVSVSGIAQRCPSRATRRAWEFAAVVMLACAVICAAHSRALWYRQLAAVQRGSGTFTTHPHSSTFIHTLIHVRATPSTSHLLHHSSHPLYSQASTFSHMHARTTINFSCVRKRIYIHFAHSHTRTRTIQQSAADMVSLLINFSCVFVCQGVLLRVSAFDAADQHYSQAPDRVPFVRTYW